MNSILPKASEEDIHKGQAVYTKKILTLYDIGVLGVSNRLIWRCPTPYLQDWFNHYLTDNHLDIGVGTGYFLDHGKFTTDSPRIRLVDLNPNTLNFASDRLKRYKPETLVHDIFKPFTPMPPASETFDSISLNYVFHCLPGSLRQKAVVLDNIMPLLSPTGTLIGSTILHGGVRRNMAAKGLMKFYNNKGIFSNAEDTLPDLEQELKNRFEVGNN